MSTVQLAVSDTERQRRLPLHEVSRLPPPPGKIKYCRAHAHRHRSAFVHTTARTSSKLPVFVWLHGGSFVSGSISDAAIDGSLLAEQGNLIVVTMQYRLGMLGFLHDPKSGVSGNMAVLDVVEGLSACQRVCRFMVKQR